MIRYKIVKDETMSEFRSVVGTDRQGSGTEHRYERMV